MTGAPTGEAGVPMMCARTNCSHRLLARPVSGCVNLAGDLAVDVAKGAAGKHSCDDEGSASKRRQAHQQRNSAVTTDPAAPVLQRKKRHEERDPRDTTEQDKCATGNETTRRGRMHAVVLQADRHSNDAQRDPRDGRN